MTKPIEGRIKELEQKIESRTQDIVAYLEAQKASIEIFSEIVDGLKDLCHGIHIITIGGEEKLRHYLDAAKLS